MHDIYTYILETNYVPREYSVAAIVLLLFMVLISLVSVLNPLYFYISTFRNMCAVPNVAVFCSSLTSCFPGMLLTYFLNDFKIVPFVPIITGITFVFTFHMRCISIVRSLYKVIHNSVKHDRKLADATIDEESNDYIFQQEGSPAHYKDVRGYLNRKLSQRWIERTGKEDDALMRWPSRSPDLTPCDFFFWGFVKDTDFVPPLPANLQIFATVSPLLWLWSTVIC